jgi:hypothetical protein
VEFVRRGPWRRRREPSGRSRRGRRGPAEGEPFTRRGQDPGCRTRGPTHFTEPASVPDGGHQSKLRDYSLVAPFKNIAATQSKLQPLGWLRRYRSVFSGRPLKERAKGR